MRSIGWIFVCTATFHELLKWRWFFFRRMITLVSAGRITKEISEPKQAQNCWKFEKTNQPNKHLAVTTSECIRWVHFICALVSKTTFLSLLSRRLAAYISFTICIWAFFFVHVCDYCCFYPCNVIGYSATDFIACIFLFNLFLAAAFHCARGNVDVIVGNALVTFKPIQTTERRPKKIGSTHIGKYACPERAIIAIVVMRVMRLWNSLIDEMQSYIDFDWLHTLIYHGHQDNTTKVSRFIISNNNNNNASWSFSFILYALHHAIDYILFGYFENRVLLFWKYLLESQQ